VVGYVSNASVGQLVGQLGNLNIASNPSTTIPTAQTATSLVQTSKVNSVQSMHLKNPQQPGGKKNKKKNSNSG
jgi:hypothetical protein